MWMWGTVSLSQRPQRFSSPFYLLWNEADRFPSKDCAHTHQSHQSHQFITLKLTVSPSSRPLPLSPPSSCHVCDFQTEHNAQFVSHMSLHVDKEQWMFSLCCSVCDYACMEETDMKNHISTGHAGMESPEFGWLTVGPPAQLLLAETQFGTLCIILSFFSCIKLIMFALSKRGCFWIYLDFFF